MRIHPLILASISSSLAAVACSDNLTPLPTATPYQAANSALPSCVPNLDGQIDSTELNAAIGVPVSYRVSPAGTPRMIDVAGQLDTAGHRVFDWSLDLADDQIAKIEASPLAGKWYAASFPNGGFVTPFDAGDSIEAVYTKDDHNFALLGLASTEEHPAIGQTLLIYTAPIVLYRFPITVGSNWTSTGEIHNGVFKGLPFASRDTYQISDDATGLLNLPDLSFSQVHRIRTKLTVQPSVGAAVTSQQVSLFFECFGEVARATSNNDEPMDDFTTASEVRRLGL